MQTTGNNKIEILVAIDVAKGEMNRPWIARVNLDRTLVFLIA